MCNINATYDIMMISNVHLFHFHHLMVVVLRSYDVQIPHVCHHLQKFRKKRERERERQITLNKYQNVQLNVQSSNRHTHNCNFVFKINWMRLFDILSYRILRWSFAPIRLKVLLNRTPTQFWRIVESKMWWYWNDVPIQPPCNPMGIHDDSCAILRPLRQSKRQYSQLDWFFYHMVVFPTYNYLLFGRLFI